MQAPVDNAHPLDVHELRAWLNTIADLELHDTADVPIARKIHESGFFRGVVVGLAVARLQRHDKT